MRRLSVSNRVFNAQTEAAQLKLAAQRSLYQVEVESQRVLGVALADGVRAGLGWNIHAHTMHVCICVPLYTRPDAYFLRTDYKATFKKNVVKQL